MSRYRNSGKNRETLARVLIADNTHRQYPKGTMIPIDSNNRDYREFLEWSKKNTAEVSNGNDNSIFSSKPLEGS